MKDRNEGMVGVLCKVYDMKGGIRYRRKDAVYLLIAIIEDMFTNKKFLKIIEFGRTMIYRSLLNAIAGKGPAPLNKSINPSQRLETAIIGTDRGVMFDSATCNCWKCRYKRDNQPNTAPASGVNPTHSTERAIQ